MRETLKGLLVIAVEQAVAAPYCSSRLADAGARVIKVERPEGDFARGYDRVVHGESAYFVWLNRGKESIALDLKDDGDRLTFERLLGSADVIVENFRPGTMEKLGYGWESLHERYPKLIYAAVSGFGHSGPHSQRPAYDMVVQAMGGIMSITGEPGGESMKVGVAIVDLMCGMYASVAILGALRHRDQGGGGQYIDLALLDTHAAWLINVA